MKDEEKKKKSSEKIVKKNPSFFHSFFFFASLGCPRALGYPFSSLATRVQYAPILSLLLGFVLVTTHIELLLVLKLIARSLVGNIDSDTIDFLVCCFFSFFHLFLQ
jgi:hypothetical protein